MKNGRISLEEIHNFLQLHTQHHEVTGGKWDKVTLGTGTNIAAAAAKIDIEQKVNVAIMEIQTRMTWHCLISLLRICQLDTLYLHRDVYHTSNELRDLSVDMTNTKVVSSAVLTYTLYNFPRLTAEYIRTSILFS